MSDALVLDASPLILLSRAEALDLVRGMASKVVVPEAVAAEVAARGAEDVTVVAMRSASWLSIVPAIPVPEALARWDLGAGESAVLALAASQPGAVAVLDDGEARRCAESLGIPFTGTVAIVLRAKREGRIPLGAAGHGTPAAGRDVPLGPHAGPVARARRRMTRAASSGIRAGRVEAASLEFRCRDAAREFGMR